MSAYTSISTHVLDTALGTPAVGVNVIFERVDPNVTTEISRDFTDTDGRATGLVPGGATIVAGTYRLTFDVASYFASTQRSTFYRVIRIEFEVGGLPEHYHVPLLLSPFGYATYRGS
jgi:5-hydroxyisourate hydrolase